MKKYLVLLFTAAAISSCATQELYLNVTQPAPVTIAPEIKTGCFYPAPPGHHS